MVSLGRTTIKILLLDIETAPNIVHTWGLFNQFVAINQIVESGFTLCWAAKWLGEKQIIYSGLDTDTSKNMVKKMHKLLNEADAVITYNGNRFDLPTLNKEFVKLGLKPPAPYKKIDLLNTARSKFRFVSNKLDYVAQFLGLGAKEKHKGHSLWVGCMSKDAASWKVMQKYNKQDVVLLEKVYKVMLPWIAAHPNRSVHEQAMVCPICGSKHFQKRGTANTQAGVYQRYQCSNVECGHWFRDNKNMVRGTMKAASLPV